MKAIKFKVNSLPYTAGEIAGFPDREADRFVKAGHADYWVEEKKPAPAPAPAPAKPAPAKKAAE